ncbi:MAG: hypothetical protein ABSG53_10880 [Thermoguttaceae bacterium]|jgi:hypothetical protein
MSSSSMTGTNSDLSARDRSRRRKWIYGLSMIVLIVVLFVLSRPATLGTKTVQGQPGGVLAHYRDEHGLSQTELGQIDPTSETIRLATLGMRGFASTTLGLKAIQFQMKKDWTRLRATLDQSIKLQPHSIYVWRYQAWNLSYNVSVSFDDYHDKFYWVIEGLNYMLDGVRMNDREPRLCWDMGWFISNKIGRDDAAKYYRRLFTGERGPDGKDAPDYVKDFRERFTPPSGFPLGSNLRDNWHVGKAWFLAAESKIDPPRYPVRGMATVIFYSDAPTCQFYYADNLEKDGTFGQVARRAWQDAEKEWHAFGDRSIDTSYDIALQLNRREELIDQAEEMKDRLDALAPGVREDLEKEKRGKLTPEDRVAWNKYREDLVKYKKEKKDSKSGKNEKPLLQPSVDKDLGDRAEAQPDEIARRAPQAHREEALKLAREIERDETLALYTNRERSKVNFDFWRTRAGAEQTPECLDARKATHDGDEAYAKGDMIRARPEYEKGLRGWRKVLDNPEFHSLVDDVSLGGDLIDVIRRYEKCLAQDDQDLPDPFILQDVVDKHGSRQGMPLPPVVVKKVKPSSAAPASPDKKGKSSSANGPDPKSKRP